MSSLSRTTVNIIVSDIDHRRRQGGVLCECELKEYDAAQFQILCPYHLAYSEGCEALIEQVGYGLETFFEDFKR